MSEDAPVIVDETFAVFCVGRVVPVVYKGRVIGSATLSVGDSDTGPVVIATARLDCALSGEDVTP
jgi:hypothetical protein